MVNLQMSFLSSPYKYVIDTSSLITQKEDRAYPRSIHKTLWETIDKMLKTQRIILCSEVKEEITAGNDELVSWIKNINAPVIPIDDEIQYIVINILEKHHDIIEFKAGKSSTDVFVIATAKKYNCIVVTEEGKRRVYKIVCAFARKPERI